MGHFFRPLRIEDQTICLTSEGEAWQEGRKGYTGFIHMFCEARKAAGIDGVSFGDLRGTAVTRLALAGCTVPEICAITGHGHEDANRILQAHYLHRDPQIAWNAIRKLEAYQVRLATARTAKRTAKRTFCSHQWNALSSMKSMAGAPGFEPGNGGIKIRHSL
jgi:hypothetical protein